MKTITMTITPRIAEEWLQMNYKSNRTIREDRVRRYAHDIVNGTWSHNGESIKFNEDGILVDGQHRLKAIIKANRSIKTEVAFGVPNDVFIFDKGAARTIGDTAKFQNIGDIPNPNLQSALIRIIFQIRDGVHRKTCSSDREVIDYFFENEDRCKFACNTARVGKDHALLTKAPVFCAIYILDTLGFDRTEIARFCIIANSGFADSDDQSAAIVFRNYLLSAKTNGEKIDTMSMIDAMLQMFRDFHEHFPRRKIVKVNPDTTGWIAEFKKIENNHKGDLT